MTITTEFRDEISTGQDYIGRARAVAPTIRAEANRIEEERQLTAPVIQALRDKGLYWMLVPEALGGGGVGIVDALKVLEVISSADGSTGWSFMANSFGNAIASGYLPASGVQKLFGGDDKAITCGFSGPVGTAVKVEGGILAKADRLPFGSGTTYANWIGSGVRMVDEQGNDIIAENGMIDARFAYAPAERINLLGNWNVSGLVGTGSVDYQLPEQFIPDDMVLSVFSTTPNRSEGVYGFGLFGIGVAGHAGVALGIMRRALEEVAAIAVSKSRAGYEGTIAEQDFFKREFVIKDAEFQAARAYTFQVFSDAEQAFLDDGSLSNEHHARIRQVATWLHNVADEVTSFTQLWGGQAAFRKPSALGRCTRDIAIAKSHLLVDQKTLVDAAPPIINSWLINDKPEN